MPGRRVSGGTAPGPSGERPYTSDGLITLWLDRTNHTGSSAGGIGLYTAHPETGQGGVSVKTGIESAFTWNDTPRNLLHRPMSRTSETGRAAQPSCWPPRA